MKNLIAIPIIAVLFTLFQVVPYNVQAEGTDNNSYGVFIGMDSNKIDKLIGYKEVVIDGSDYTKAQIDYLHKNGVKVYNYLNIGSLEDFRPYYNDFVNITLSDYEGWSGERWIDISNAKWQDYIVNVRAKDLSDKGIDGFFLDNIDVYSQYKNDNIFNGILNVMNRLNSTYKLPIIANGGYDFFTEAMNKNLDISKLVYGVNTESVYTTVGDNNKLLKNSNQDRKDAVDYLEILKSKGLAIYIIEYTKSNSLAETISSYFNKLNFKYYISSSLDLDGSSVYTGSSSTTVEQTSNATTANYKNPDVNGDGKVDVKDVASISQNYNVKSGSSDCNASYDINNDGIIDMYDLVIIERHMQ